MTNKEAIDSAAVRLNLNNIENSLYDSKQMFMEASGMSTTDYLMHMTDDISNEVHENLRTWFKEDAAMSRFSIYWERHIFMDTNLL